MLGRIRAAGVGVALSARGSCSLGGRPWRCPWPGRTDGDAGRGGRDTPAEAPNQRLPTLSCPGYHLPSPGTWVEITPTFIQWLLCARLNARCLKGVILILSTTPPPLSWLEGSSPFSRVHTRRPPELQLAQGPPTKRRDSHPGTDTRQPEALRTTSLDLHLPAPQVADNPQKQPEAGCSHLCTPVLRQVFLP